MYGEEGVQYIAELHLHTLIAASYACTTPCSCVLQELKNKPQSGKHKAELPACLAPENEGAVFHL